MNIRKKRIIGWVLSLILAALLIVGENVSKNVDTNTMFKEKTPITVCAPDDMKDAFKSALHNSGLNHDYKIVMTSDPNSNICVDYGKENDTNQKFMESSNTEEVSNFDEKIERVGGFPENVFFILPEKTVYDLVYDHYEYTRIFYPTQTVYFNYYVKGDELGNKVISAFDDDTAFHDFYYDLNGDYYRSHSHSELTEMSRLYDERNVYNVIKIPKNSGL